MDKKVLMSHLGKKVRSRFGFESDLLVWKCFHLFLEALEKVRSHLGIARTECAEDHPPWPNEA